MPLTWGRFRYSDQKGVNPVQLVQVSTGSVISRRWRNLRQLIIVWQRRKTAVVDVEGKSGTQRVICLDPEETLGCFFLLQEFGAVQTCLCFFFLVIIFFSFCFCVHQSISFPASGNCCQGLLQTFEVPPVAIEVAVEKATCRCRS